MHRRRLHGAIAPMAQKLWGDAPKSPPQELCYVVVVHVQRVSKNYEYVIMTVKKVH